LIIPHLIPSFHSGEYLMAANTQSAEAFDDYAFKLDHNIRDNRVEPDTIADPEGAESRAVAASHAQLPPFVTEDFTPRYNEATARWVLIPKQPSIAALESEAREIYEYQSTRTEILERAAKLTLAMETIVGSVGQWTALDFARNTMRNGARSLCNGVRTSVSAYNWAMRQAENHNDTSGADDLMESAATQVEDCVVLMVAVHTAATEMLGGEANLNLDPDWSRAARDALALEGARHTKKYLEALTPEAGIERQKASTRAALGVLKGKVAA
jgi:hypothetical protein